MDDLNAACRKGSEYDVKQSLKFFLHRVNHTNSDGYTPLYLASLCPGDKLAIVNLLVANGADVNLPVKDGSTPLIAAAEEGNVECLIALLLNAAEVNRKKQNGRTALIVACWEQHLTCVEALLDSGADTNLVSNTGCSALYFACRSNDKDCGERIVQFLLSHNANPNIATKSGRSPLHEAAEHGLDSIVTLLITAGADVNLQDSHGHTAWDLATTEPVRQALMAKQMEDLLHQSSSLHPLLSYEANDPFVLPSLPESSSLNDDVASTVLLQQSSTPPPKPPRQRTQPSLQHLNSQHQRLLLTLAEASPQTIVYLRSLGDNGSASEAQYQQIMATPPLKQFYLQFNRTLSPVALALLVINSKMVGDARSSNPEKFLDMANALAQSSSLPAVPLATGLIRFLVKLPSAMDRAKRVRSLTTVFPSIDSHKFIEILARELTVEQRLKIEELYQSDLENATMLEKRSLVVEKLVSGISWVYEAVSGNESARWNNVQTFAEASAGRLLEQLMLQGEALGVIELQHLKLFKAWTVGFDTIQEYENERRQLVEQQMKISSLSIPPFVFDQSERSVPPELEIPVCQSTQGVVNENSNYSEQVQQLQDEVAQLTAKLVAVTRKVDRFERLEQQQHSPISNTSSPRGQGDGGQILQQVQLTASTAVNGSQAEFNNQNAGSDLLRLQQQVARLEEALILATSTLQPTLESFEEISLQSPKSNAHNSKRREDTAASSANSPMEGMTVDTQGCCTLT